MHRVLKDLILRAMIVAIWLQTGISKEDEICLWSTYDATCGDNEVIQMVSGLYGRMSVGRCISKDFDVGMGCQVDVLTYLDSVCSGRQSCQLRLPQDHPAPEYQPCPRGLESYLQLKYNCIIVISPTKPCSGNPIPVTGTNGFLANYVTEGTGQGSQECPWEIRGSPGQRIRLTLHDYGVWTPSKPQGGDAGVNDLEESNMCHIYARVREVTSESSVTICGGEMREKIVYLSETEGVHIALTNPKHNQHSSYFLLRYEIIGCLTYIPPEGTVIVRRDNDILVTCPGTGSEWKMVCDGTRWQAEGNITNCTVIKNERTQVDKREPSVSTEALLEGGLTLSQGLVIAFFLSIAVLIAVIIMVVGIVVLRRRQDTLMESTPGYNCKEHFPMLTKDQRENQSLPDRGYTSTGHSHGSVPPGSITTRGQFPPLPLPPRSSFTEAGHCTIHDTLSRDRYPRNSNQVPQPFIEQHLPSQWPTLSRTKNHFYHELDPEHVNVHTGSPQDRKKSVTEGFDVDDNSIPLPDVLSAS